MTQRTTPSQAGSAPLPAAAGIGLRHSHVPAFLDGRPPVAWLEVHAENYLARGGPRLAALEAIRRDYPLSCHGVGLSLGSALGLDPAHLARLRALYDRLQPALVSEHLAWSVTGGVYLNDLLPLPYTEEALDLVCRNLDHAQQALGRRLLVENPSAYLRFSQSRLTEAEFLGELVRRTGCGLLLDVNNLHVSGRNLGIDGAAYLAAIPGEAVGEIHVAGHSVQRIGGEALLIDDHGSAVDAAVWGLLEAALARLGPRPVLVEWDTRLPSLDVLLAEADQAETRLAARRAPTMELSHAA